jgi:hypothetical protein
MQALHGKYLTWGVSGGEQNRKIDESIDTLRVSCEF